jgi:D-alanyl-D-alanine endopeptidase (penicillin-binding protein 7)
MHQRRLKLIAALVALASWAGTLGVPAPVEAATRRATSQSTAKKTAKPSSSARTRTAKAPARSSASKSTTRAKARAARAARLARAKAARRAREYREVATPLFRTDESGNVVPDVRAAAAIIYNPVTQEVLWEENAESPRSIASITKVMTAVVLLEVEPDLSREIKIESADVRGSRHYYVRAGETMRIDDALHLTLIASDNAAAKALARTSVLGYDGFIAQMNAKARELGLDSTTYADPSGLNAGNVSSALDMARLIAYASNDDRISPIMRKNEYRVTTSRRVLTVHNTNRLVGSEVEVQGGKTGFIRQSGYCLATLLKLPQGDQVAVVVLGARSNAGRFMETRHLFNWVAGKAQSLLGAAQRPVPDDHE